MPVKLTVGDPKYLDATTELGQVMYKEILHKSLNLPSGQVALISLWSGRLNLPSGKVALISLGIR